MVYLNQNKNKQTTRPKIANYIRFCQWTNSFKCISNTRNLKEKQQEKKSSKEPDNVGAYQTISKAKSNFFLENKQKTSFARSHDKGLRGNFFGFCFKHLFLVFVFNFCFVLPLATLFCCRLRFRWWPVRKTTKKKQRTIELKYLRLWATLDGYCTISFAYTYGRPQRNIAYFLIWILAQELFTAGPLIFLKHMSVGCMGCACVSTVIWSLFENVDDVYQQINWIYVDWRGARHSKLFFGLILASESNDWTGETTGLANGLPMQAILW